MKLHPYFLLLDCKHKQMQYFISLPVYFNVVARPIMNLHILFEVLVQVKNKNMNMNMFTLTIHSHLISRDLFGINLCSVWD